IWSRQQAFHLGWRDSEMNPTTCHDFSPTKDNRDGLNSRVTVLVYNSPPSFQEQFSLATIWPSMCCAWSPLGQTRLCQLSRGAAPARPVRPSKRTWIRTPRTRNRSYQTSLSGRLLRAVLGGDLQHGPSQERELAVRQAR